MAMLAELVDGVIGVDTHRDTLTAAAVSHLGGVLGHTTTSADAAGYQRLLDFAQAQLPGRRCWAVEGADSFGAGLAGFLQQHGEQVLEVGRPTVSGRPVAVVPRATRWTRSGPLARRLAKTTWPPHGVGVSGRRLRVLLTTRRCATLARIASSASLLAPLRLAGRLGRPTSTTRSPRCCNIAVRPAPKLPAPSTAHRRRPGT